MAFALKKYQREGIDFLRSHDRALLGDEPGMGKTAQLLHAAEGRTLVLAPAMVLDSGTWEQEAFRWRPDIDATFCAYSSLPAREKTAKGGSRPLSVPRSEYAGRWDTVICDEAHHLKGRKTTWTRALEKLKFDRLYLATGTPIPNWAHELYIPAKLLHPGDPDFRGYWPWAKQWFDVAPTRWSPMAVGDLRPDRTWDEFYEANLGAQYLARPRSEVDLPPLMHPPPTLVPMTPAQAKVYRDLRKDFIAWLESGTEVVAWNTAAQTVKLAKAATGLQVLDPTVRESGKLDHLEEILRDRPRPTLVVCHFRDSAAACAEVARRAGKSVEVLTGAVARPIRRKPVERFQRGDLDVLVGTVDLISEGMTLTAADCVIRVERSYRPSRNEQVIRRLHRMGQVRPVLALDLVSAGTIEERVLGLLARKTDQQLKALKKTDLLRLV